MSTADIKRTSAIEGEFSGYCPQSLFKLQDGTYWLQIDSKIHMHQAINPKVKILPREDGHVLTVAGLESSVQVTQLLDVVESHIRGKFQGWSGQSAYTLVNGQTWQQAKYYTKYIEKYMPEVLIYRSSTGPIMHVAGTSVKVRQIR